MWPEGCECELLLLLLSMPLIMNNRKEYGTYIIRVPAYKYTSYTRIFIYAYAVFSARSFDSCPKQHLLL